MTHRLQNALVFAKALDHPGLLLGHEEDDCVEGQRSIEGNEGAFGRPKLKVSF